MSSKDQDKSSGSDSGETGKISPDPRIIVSSLNIKPPDRVTDEASQPPSRPRTSVEFIWQIKDESYPQWYQSVGGATPALYNSKDPVSVNGAVDDSRAPNRRVAELVTVTVVDKTSTFIAAEAFKRKDLDDNQAEFKLTAAVGATFDFRLDAGPKQNPATSGYYIRTGAAGNYLFASYFGSISGDTVDNPYKNVTVTDQYGVNVYNSLWVMPQAQWTGEHGSPAGIMSLFASGTTNEYFSWATPPEGIPGNLQLTSAFTGTCWWSWDPNAGAIYHPYGPPGSTTSFWTAPSEKGDVITLTDKTLAPNQQWNLVPAHLGPTATGKGVLGPSSS